VTFFIKIVRSAWANEVLTGSASALAIKFTASVLGFVMFALASRHMDPAAFGTLAMIFNAMSFLAVVALCGQETLIVRSWDEYCGTHRPQLARGVLTFGAQVATVVPLTVAVVAGLGWLAWDRTASIPLVIAACSFLVAQAVIHFSWQFSRVAVGLVIGEVPREVMWRLIVVAVIAAGLVAQIGLSAVEFFAIAAGAILVAIAFQVWRVARALPAAVVEATPQRDIAAWIPRSFKMWLSALMDITGQYLEVVVIGLVLGPTSAGFYFVVTRITNVFAMISGGITTYATTQISGLFHADAKAELQHILRSLAVISTIVVAAAFTVILLAGKLLLLLFGAAYVPAYPALIVMAAAAAVAALAGPASALLLMTGNEGRYPRIVGCGIVLRFALIAILGPLLGLMGAAIAWSVSALAIALALVIASRRLVGVDPSLTSAFVRGSRPAVPVTGGAP
jgi:O-antigen/teichoic acid export membrane protein